MCPALRKAQAVEEPLQLTARDGKALVFGLVGPAEASALQASVVEPEAVVVPGEDLEFVFVSIAENEEAITEEVALEDLADNGGEAVDGFTQIGASAGEVDASCV